MLKLEKRHFEVLKSILDKYPYHFYAYGSRVKGTSRKFSYLDLCYQDEIPGSIATKIRWELEESNLPFIVELVNWKHMRPAFQKIIKKDLLPLS